ncbi:MAG TPA: PilZ domain-containing protein [Holophagaceae bacterium]|nr:PilZ domain-containing protein [Holophagaceae bacterium]
MDAASNRRDARRVILPTQATLSFQLGGQRLENLSMANISHGGCLAMIPTTISQGAVKEFLVRGAFLPDLRIHYPGIEAAPIVGRVAWSMGSDQETQAIGIQFVEMDSSTRISIVATVDAAIIDQPEDNYRP